MYFSYEVGPAHIISLASFYPGGFGASSPLTQWLQNDLASIDRSKTPWVLVSLHARALCRRLPRALAAFLFSHRLATPAYSPLPSFQPGTIAIKITREMVKACAWP